MIQEKFRIFKLLLYKNFLVRKRHWKIGLFVELMIPLLIVFSMWSLRSLIAYDSYQTLKNTIFPIDPKEDHLPKSMNRLLVAPDNEFIKIFMKDVQKCLRINSDRTIMRFKTEKDMLAAYNDLKSENPYDKIMAIVFENENLNMSTIHLKYKLQSYSAVPETLYADGILSSSMRYFQDGTIGLQLCLDETFIKIKGRNQFRLNVHTQKMPSPEHVIVDLGDSGIRKLFCAFALIAFLIPLCIETSNASEEKFIGVNVLMAMNGVSNLMNLLSWLISGLIFSLLYTVPIAIMMNFSCSENTLPYLLYGNTFLFWIMLTLHVAHLISFGIHVSAYFARSLFMITGLLIIYVGSTSIQNYGIKENSLGSVAYLGLLFPNMLLFRGLEEFNYYESIAKGIHFSNMFTVGNPQFGPQGSVGMILIFSLLGTIFHLIMAIYIYAINPGKYGVKKSPFYFLKFLYRIKKTNDYDKVENDSSQNTDKKPFELVAEGVYTPGIQIRNLKKTYNTSVFSKTKVHALKGVSIDFYKGQITALLGHNGAGKSTMMSILTGMISPSEGMVLINGKNVKNNLDEIMNDMGLCPQENMVFPYLTVAEQLTFFAMLKNNNNSNSHIENAVKSLLKQLKLDEKRNTLPKKLSGGQKRRVCLGMALIGDSSTLILDEPTSGLDPESRRDIWDILLKMRGVKTILISTHDMEEADILGDRIAIVHTGNLRSYGTSMYLKKLLGKGNIEVTLSTKSWFDQDKIRSFLDPQCEILNADGSKVVLNIPNTPELPDSLDKIESNKEELGITGLSVSLITLEQVFLKVTLESDDAPELRQPFMNVAEKLKGRLLFLQSARGLLYKKITYFIKNITTFITMFCLFLVPLICISLMSMDHHQYHKDIIKIGLDMYRDPNTFHRKSSNSKSTRANLFGENYEALTKKSYGTVIETNENYSIDHALLEIGTRDIANYNYRLLAGAFINASSKHVNAKAYYNNDIAIFALPISINLLFNALVKTFVGASHEISISVQDFPDVDDKKSRNQFINLGFIEGYVMSLILVFCLYPAVALFVIHPIREQLTNVKHLQRMAGASCLNYWSTMFALDFIIFLFLTVFFIGALVIVDAVFSLHMFFGMEILIMTLLFVLFAVNIFPLIYAFSFWKKSTSAAIKLLSILPIGLITVELTMSIISIAADSIEYRSMITIRSIQRPIFLAIPYISFFHGQISFLAIAKMNGNCRRLSYESIPDVGLVSCGDLRCHHGTCDRPLQYFGNNDLLNLDITDVTLESSILSLCLTPILYFGILCILEYKLIPKLFAHIRRGKPDNTDENFEEQVKKVKHNIAFEISKIKARHQDVGKSASKKTGDIESGSNDILITNDEENSRAFLVYELRKLYGNLVAVQDLSFGVNQKECFGLLGVNGAGKSTTFKMMTGEEIPNHGMMYLDKINIMKNREKYLSQMGYCPQNDAIIRSLNSYDHLNLFARLRGISEDQVNTEVENWINRLNLKACATQPSGTYSGGNKRRLNIAMALIGIPNLVLLDEPTTGVDPAARRSLWNIIQSCQATGQAVILTSHSMEECEALCNRLAIMVNGKLECIGPSQELKQRFGAGFDIHLKLNPEKSIAEIDEIKKNMREALSCEITDENTGYLMYHVTSVDITWRRMYDVMTELKNKYESIADFSVLSSTLEQLFLQFARGVNKVNK